MGYSEIIVRCPKALFIFDLPCTQRSLLRLIEEGTIMDYNFLTTLTPSPTLPGLNRIISELALLIMAYVYIKQSYCYIVSYDKNEDQYLINQIV